jgi:hypothetical protein
VLELEKKYSTYLKKFMMRIYQVFNFIYIINYSFKIILFFKFIYLVTLHLGESTKETSIQQIKEIKIFNPKRIGHGMYITYFGLYIYIYIFINNY